MATDGIKIIDGDYARDLYHTFMSLYDAGAPLPEIKSAVEQLHAGDEFDNEIFVTVYALALWEIGALTPEILQKIEQTIAAGAVARYFAEEENLPREASRRQQVLNRFWTKINQPNPKLRKRKKHQIQKQFLFNEGDVLTFQLSNQHYCAAILMQVDQQRGRCTYQLIITTHKSLTKPTMEDIMSSTALGRWIGGSDSAIFVFDLVLTGTKALRAYADKFECIGRVDVRAEFKRCASYGYAMDFQEFTQHWVDFKLSEASSYPRRIGMPLTKVL